MSDDKIVPPAEAGEESYASNRYLIIKRGLYYKPNSSGYTGIKDYAGRYPLPDGALKFPNRNIGGLLYIHEEDAPEYSEACFYDVKLEHQLKKNIALVDAYRSVLLDIVAKTRKASTVGYIARTAIASLPSSQSEGTQ